MSNWADIRCNYICEDEDDMFWRVDAWETDDDNEEGRVIAYVDDLSGRVVYADPCARWDEEVQEIVAQKQKEIKEKRKVAHSDLWDILLAHAGHNINIAVYGDADNPAYVALEDEDTGDVIIDARLYDICARK